MFRVGIDGVSAASQARHRYDSERGAYTTFCAVRIDLAKSKHLSESGCVSSNIFNKCAFHRNQLAIVEKAACDHYASNGAWCFIFY